MRTLVIDLSCTSDTDEDAGSTRVAYASQLSQAPEIPAAQPRGGLEANHQASSTRPAI